MFQDGLDAFSRWMSDLPDIDDGVIGELIDELADFLRDFLSDPIVLDLDGDGIELTALANSTTRFDLDEDGIAERTGWAGPNDGLLVNDKDGDGHVDGISELVGSARVDGFDALKPLDANNDGKVNAADPAFAALRVWRDVNANGISDPGELLTLADAGIAAFKLAYTQVDRDVAGNTLARLGSYTRTDGSQRAMGSVWFALDQTTTLPEVPAGTDMGPLLALPNLTGGASIPDLRTAMALDPGLKAMVEAIVDGDGDFETMSVFTDEAFQPLLFRWLGVDGPPALGDEEKPQYVRAIEAVTGQALPIDALIARGPEWKTEVLGQWTNVVDAFATRFFIQAVERPVKFAYLEADKTIAALDPNAPNFADAFSAVLADLITATTEMSPPPGIGRPFAMLSINPSTGRIEGDFHQFVDAFIDDMQPYFRPVAIMPGSAPPPMYNFNGAIVSQEWYDWYTEHGSFVFDVAAQMDLGKDTVLNATGWNWVMATAKNIVGTDSNDVLGLPAASNTGPERLNGFEGDDTLRGNDGVDILIGGLGNDLLYGGSGSDMYVYGAGDGLGCGDILGIPKLLEF